jgi:hypothetical protein
MIDFGDGNGNQYIIEQGSIEYNPIKPKFSSSVIYDGGEAITNEESHIKNRVKLSGVITLQEGKVVKSCILSPNSEELREIEKILKNTIKG